MPHLITEPLAAAEGERVLVFAARMATQVLLDMGSPGTRFLYLL